MIVHWDEAPKRRSDEGPMGATWTFLGDAAGARTIGVRRIEVEPGRRSTPVHVHGAEEEIFFVLGGSGLSWQDGETYEVRAGDTLVHLAGAERHTLRAGPEGLDVLAFGQRLFAEISILPRVGVAWVWPGLLEARDGESSRPEVWRREADAGELEFPEPGERPSRIVAFDAVEEVEADHGDCHYRMRDLARAAGSVKTGMKHYALAPGKLGAPPHCHSAEEELLVVLEGDGSLLLYEHQGTRLHEPRSRDATEEHPVRRGHVVSRHAGSRVAHAFRAGENGLSFLAYGTREPNDIAYYPRSGKIYFRGVGVMTRVEKLDYWDGEEEPA